MIWKNCTPWKNIFKFSREVRDRPLKTKSVEVCYIVTDGRHAENSFKIIFMKFDLNQPDMDCFSSAPQAVSILSKIQSCVETSSWEKQADRYRKEVLSNLRGLADLFISLGLTPLTALRPFCPSSRPGMLSFTNRAPLVWNSLPASIKQAQTMNFFKSEYLKHLSNSSNSLKQLKLTLRDPM